MAERLAALGLALFFVALPCAARDEPLWEAGVGLGALSFPDYRGSDQSRGYVLPAPYLVYRGEGLRADRNGLRGLLFNTDRVDFDLSVGAALPVSSSRNRAREGMEDLKPSLEAGPALNITIARADDRRWSLDLRMPVRFAVTVERDPRFVGTQFYPHLNVDVHDVLGFGGWNLGVLAGPIYTDGRYNRHFYSVPAAFATAERPTYEARGGFGGSEFIVALSKRYPRFFVGGFLRADSLRGAEFEDSPLVKSRHYVAAGVGVSWILGASQKRVAVDRYGENPR